MANRGLINIIRDILDSSHAIVILVGEPTLPTILQQWPRVIGRISNNWVPSLPCDQGDSALLARLYCPGIELDPDLIAAIVTETAGCTRLVCANLDDIRRRAGVRGLSKAGLEVLPMAEMITGKLPGRKAAA